MAHKKSLFTQLNEQKWSFLFIAPAVLLFLIFVLGPLIASFYWSFTDFNGIQAAKWVGLANYKHIFLNDPRFWKSVRNTVIYTVGVIPPGMALSLMLAMAVDQQIRFKNFFRTIYFIPSVTSVIALSVIWKWLFAGEKYGLINHLLILMGLKPIDWLMSPVWTLPAIMIMSIWAGIGYNMILFLAGLQTIPTSVYEAADIDGANVWGKFWNITLPLLKPTMVFVVIMGFIASFQVFERIYIMTESEFGIGGVLDSALTIVAYLYDMGFRKFQMGYASALGYVIFAAVFIITIVNIRFVKTKVEY
ncbi:MAG: sugar ABC transporter permease [Candidatus Omnitrophica bacterium]|nr:sugar ABC transporter permease [Candidatus Omnitrophota bacterium]